MSGCNATYHLLVHVDMKLTTLTDQKSLLKKFFLKCIKLYKIDR